MAKTAKKSTAKPRRTAKMETKTTSKAKSSPARRKKIAKAVGNVSQTNARSDEDALYGHFCEAVSGPEKGLYGVIIAMTNFSEEDGYPQSAVVEARDETQRRVTVDYSDLRRAEAGRR